jgi:glycosyltransferase involved in cell wall biosynthesis
LLYTFFVLFFLLACLIQICYVAFFFMQQNKRKATTPSSEIPISIIICAKNEAQNLKQFLPSILQQDYPQQLFEVIVINDQSTDESAEILSRFSSQYSQLKVLTISPDTVKTLPGKKYALSQGIAAAQYDRVLLTDADCTPSSDQWLKEMAGVKEDIVLGYGAYETHPGLLNQFIRWETVNTCMQYASYAKAGLTYMGVGRNLSYRKSLLKDIEKDTAFQQIYTNTPSGDDDLLIGKIATKTNVALCLSKNAHTISIPQKTWKAWWRQKTRHASTGKYYQPKIKNLLGLYGLSHSLYWFSGIILIIIQIANCQLPTANCSLATPNYLVPALFAIRLLLYWTNAAQWYNRLGEKKLLLFYPLGDLGWALYNVFLSPYIFWKNRQAWK